MNYFIMRITPFLLFILFITAGANAQFISAEIGVNGLTCSACTRTVEMSLRKLDFVKDVKMDLENTDGQVIFQPKSNVSAEKLANAVTAAGFSVRFINIVYHSDSAMSVNDNYCFSYDGNSYQFIGITQQARLSGDVTLKLVGKEFLPPKDFKKWKNEIKPVCANTQSVYFITL
jgi:copper chaperone CopZ